MSPEPLLDAKIQLMAVKMADRNNKIITIMLKVL